MYSYDSDSDGLPPVPGTIPADDDAPAPEQPKTCLERLLTAWGWFFDIMTVGINITDVVSDILVAIQFFQDGHKTWAWLVLSSLMLSNIVYTIFGVEVMLRENLGVEFFRPFQYILVFPLAQLAPTVNWILEMVHPSSIQISSRHANWDLGGAGDGSNGPGAVAEESNAIASDSLIMKRLEMALHTHFRTHLLFYIETVVESIPQSIIQLLAITFLGQATGLQVFSMSLSLVSIVSKAYVVSHSFTIKAMVFKFMIVAHDLFSLFYVFSTILSKDESEDVTFASMTFNYLSYIWLIRLFVEVAYALCALIIVGIAIVIDEFIIRSHSCSKSAVAQCFGVVGLVILLAIPVVIAAEGAKLIWLILYMTNIEPRAVTYPGFALIHSFISRGNRDERLRYIVKHAIDDSIAEDKKARLQEIHAGRAQQAREAMDRARREAENGDEEEEDEEHIERGVEEREPISDSDDFARGLPAAGLPAPPPPRRLRHRRHAGRKRRGGPAPSPAAIAAIAAEDGQPSRPEDIDAFSLMDTYTARIYRVIMDVPFRSHDLFWKGHAPRSVGLNTNAIKCNAETFAGLGATVGLFIYTISQLFGLVFPFVNYGINYSKQNLLQHFCFIALAVAVLFLLLLSPSAYEYVWFCLEMGYFTRRHSRDANLQLRAKKWISDYHVPPHTYILMNHISPDILPPDVVGEVAEFLAPTSLNLKSLTISECHAIKERMIDQMEMAADIDEVIQQTLAGGVGGGEDEPAVVPVAENGDDCEMGSPVFTDQSSAGGMGARQLSDVIPQ